MNRYKVTFRETRSREGSVVVTATSPDAAAEKVGNIYRYGRMTSLRDCDEFTCGVFEDTLYPRPGVIVDEVPS
jgi:hypothetical protein